MAFGGRNSPQTERKSWQTQGVGFLIAIHALGARSWRRDYHVSMLHFACRGENVRCAA